MDNKIIGIIMANHRKDSMKSSLPKVMHKVCGHPMIEYVLECVLGISPCEPYVIVGEDGPSIKDYLGPPADYVQESQGLSFLDDKEGYALVVSGDLPLITQASLQNLVDHCKEGDYDALIISPKIYCFKISSLPKGSNIGNALDRIKSHGKKIGIHYAYDSRETIAVDNRVGLAKAAGIMGGWINERHQENGVTMLDPNNTYIGPHVSIGRDTIIYPGNILEGDSSIGEGCTLYQNNRIVDSTIGRDTVVQTSVILESTIENEVNIGPFAYLRPNSHISDRVKIGDFVEIKNAKIREDSKISHLSYVGDGEVGKNVNIGCGVVFVNYDGKNKHAAIVEDNAFIGCNTNLVAPVRVKEGAYVAAGSTITEEVPPNALAIARARQINKENWIHKYKKDKQEKQDKQEAEEN